MQSSARKPLIEAVESLRGRRVMIVGASWRKDTAHDLDLVGARAFVDVFEAMGRPSRLSLFIVARGGNPAFADQVIRTTRGAECDVEVIIPSLCNGVATLLAMTASNTVLTVHGGLGAYDAGPLGADTAALDHDLVEYVPALGGLDIEATLPAQLATGVRQRMLARELARRLSSHEPLLEALSQYGLGPSIGLGAAVLSSVGLETETVSDPALWDLFLAVERALQLRAAPVPAYTESDLADEVEFEPAHGLTTALIESTDLTREFVIDTGRPEPDTGRYVGEWQWDDDAPS